MLTQRQLRWAEPLGHATIDQRVQHEQLSREACSTSTIDERSRPPRSAILPVQYVPKEPVEKDPKTIPDRSTVTIDPSFDWGTWEGWGTSLAWWAKAFGNRDDLADAFFSLSWQNLNGQKLPGLGFNIARYNAGACSGNSIGALTMVKGPHMSAAKQIDGFWIDWMSTDPASTSWDWSVDGNQRAMLLKSQQRGADIFELFSNSPMWWMCLNSNPAGADDGRDGNLQPWNLRQHAVYLSSIAKHARDNWDIAFQSVEPFNEPDGDWWSGVAKDQEGCRISPDLQGPVIDYLRDELNARGLPSTLVAASDANTYDTALAIWQALAFTRHTQNIGRVNVHGYQGQDGRRNVLSDVVRKAGKPIWNSEYGDGDATGRQLVSNLILDFRWLHPTAWIYWQVVDIAGWGLIEGDISAGTLTHASQKYFLLAMFTRHIRPGMRILDSGRDNVVAAYDAGRRKLIIVAVNWGEAQYVNFELSRFKQASVDEKRVLRWRTQIGDGGDRYADYWEDTFMRGTKFWSWFDRDTVQTFEVDDVVL
ncbi:hypothetical protein LTR95_003524 [Oleoguttula sp. CCFEE 5521]